MTIQAAQFNIDRPAFSQATRFFPFKSHSSSLSSARNVGVPMADFAPPSGPPPPQVPQGWKAIWNEQYQEWFYVNLSTKQSQVCIIALLRARRQRTTSLQQTNLSHVHNANAFAVGEADNTSKWSIRIASRRAPRLRPQQL